MKILVIQSRMGIGDMVIFLPFIEAISRKFNSPITLLVKESSKADQYLNNNSHIKKIINLKRSKKKKDYHDGFLGFFRLTKELKNYSFDIAFIFNSSLRYNLICRFAGVKQIHQYPLFKKNKQHVIEAPKNLLLNKLNLKIDSKPEIFIDEFTINNAIKKFSIDNNQINILLGIGGSGPTKRVSAKIFIKFMELCLKNYNCKFFLATGQNKEEQKILNEITSSFNEKCISLDKLNISETLPVIKNCKISICNDSSFSHLSAGLGVPTIVLICDTPLLYGNYTPKMFPVIPDNVQNVSHGTNGKDKINPEKIFEQFQSIIK